MEHLALKVVAYAAIAVIGLRLAVIAAAIPVVWGSGLYMFVRMVMNRIRQGAGQ